MRRIGYIRTSTRRQHLDLQLDAMQVAGVTDVRQEQATGADPERPVLVALLEELQPGDTLVTWRLDRVGRSMTHLLATIADLDKRGVRFQAIHEKVETTTATGRLIFHIFAALSEFERDLTTERIRAGLDAAKARGTVLGRRSVMTPAKLRAVDEMAGRGLPKAEIARAVGVSRATLYRHLESRPER